MNLPGVTKVILHTGAGTLQRRAPLLLSAFCSVGGTGRRSALPVENRGHQLPRDCLSSRERWRVPPVPRVRGGPPEHWRVNALMNDFANLANRSWNDTELVQLAAYVLRRLNAFIRSSTETAGRRGRPAISSCASRVEDGSAAATFCPKVFGRAETSTFKRPRKGTKRKMRRILP